VGITLVAQVAVATGALILYRLLATEAGTDGFAAYSLVKQASVLLFPVLSVGLIVGLPRYVALSGDERGTPAEAYLWAAIAIATCTLSTAAALAWAFPRWFAAVLFGDADRTELVGPLVALLAATVLFFVAFGYFRGQLKVVTSSSLQILAVAVLPPCVVAMLPGRSIGALVLVIAAGQAAISLLAMAPPLVRGPRGVFARVRAAGRELLGYGYRRVPADLAQVGLFALVPVLAAQAGSLTDVAYLAAGQQVLSLLGFAVLPLGLVLLPSLSRMLAADFEGASRNVAVLATLAVHAALFLTPQVLIYADVAVVGWLGESFEDAGSVVRVTVVPAALYVVYMMLRSALDAVAVKSYNSRNSVIGLAVFGAVALAGLKLDLARPVMAIAWAFAAGLTVQGLLTIATVHRLFEVHRAAYALHIALPAAALTGGLALAARPFVVDAESSLAWLAVTELVLAGLFLGALVYWRVEWPRLLAARLFERQE
jgi:O-antigen/teichoic acid export membrane protein